MTRIDDISTIFVNIRHAEFMSPRHTPQASQAAHDAEHDVPRHGLLGVFSDVKSNRTPRQRFDKRLSSCRRCRFPLNGHIRARYKAYKFAIVIDAYHSVVITTAPMLAQQCIARAEMPNIEAAIDIWHFRIASMKICPSFIMTFMAAFGQAGFCRLGDGFLWAIFARQVMMMLVVGGWSRLRMFRQLAPGRQAALAFQWAGCWP